MYFRFCADLFTGRRSQKEDPHQLGSLLQWRRPWYFRELRICVPRWLEWRGRHQRVRRLSLQHSMHAHLHVAPSCCHTMPLLPCPLKCTLGVDSVHVVWTCCPFGMRSARCFIHSGHGSTNMDNCDTVDAPGVGTFLPTLERCRSTN